MVCPSQEETTLYIQLLWSGFKFVYWYKGDGWAQCAPEKILDSEGKESLFRRQFHFAGFPDVSLLLVTDMSLLPVPGASLLLVPVVSLLLVPDVSSAAISWCDCPTSSCVFAASFWCVYVVSSWCLACCCTFTKICVPSSSVFTCVRVYVFMHNAGVA